MESKVKVKEKDNIAGPWLNGNLLKNHRAQSADDLLSEDHREFPWVLYIGCGVSILLVILVGFISLYFSRQQQERELRVENNYQILNNVEAVHHRFYEMMVDRQRFRITRSVNFLQDYNHSLTMLFPGLTALNALVKDDAQQLARIKLLRSQINDLLNFWQTEDEGSPNILSGSVAQLTFLEKVKIDKLSLSIDAIAAAEHQMLTQREERSSNLRQTTEYTIIAGTLLILVIVTILIYIILRELKFRLTAYRKEKEMNELKSSFVSLASHEFRTPLSSILLSSSLIEKYGGAYEDGNILKHSNKIKVAVNNLKGILEDFLSLEKLSAGKIQANFQSFDLVELCDEVIDEMKETIKADQHLCYKHIGLERTVTLDQNLTRNAIINLISNSIKYAGDEASITLTTGISANDVVISVKDNGVGIAEKY
ncbi:MAG: sensor histidine kinase, partial [Mucilaginibacter sp.]